MLNFLNGAKDFLIGIWIKEMDCGLSRCNITCPQPKVLAKGDLLVHRT